MFLYILYFTLLLLEKPTLVYLVSGDFVIESSISNNSDNFLQEAQHRSARLANFIIFFGHFGKYHKVTYVSYFLIPSKEERGKRGNTRLIQVSNYFSNSTAQLGWQKQMRHIPSALDDVQTKALST